MKPRLIFTALLVALVGAFALVNWGAFSTPAVLNLLVTQVEAPLGQVMLGLLGVTVFAYLVLLSTAEAVAGRERKRLSRESERLRKLAETGEDSRVEALRTELNARFDALEARLGRQPDTGAGTGTSALLGGPSFRN